MLRRLKVVCAALLALVGLQSQTLRANVKPHSLIGEGMVLQQGMKVPIWGTAADGEKVTVSCQGQTVSSTTQGGKWIVYLENLKSGGPYELTIQGDNKIQFKNILVGEVWVGSGQSNMEWPVSLSDDAERVIANSTNPMIRLFTVAKRPASGPLADVTGSWQECAPASVKSFSAVAYFFGKDLQRSQNVPVGLIHTSWGGTPAEAWTSTAALDAEPSLKYMADRQRQALKQYTQALEKYIADLHVHTGEAMKALQEGRDLPAGPGNPPVNPGRNAWGSGTLYNGMIASVIPYGIRGAIWYQGESNAGRAYEYRTLLPAMIKNWRKDWNQGDFPFLIVQLAPFLKIQAEPKDSSWAELREAQLYTAQTLPNTAVAVITDVGHETDIHPKWKEPVGHRLALAAQALAYGQKVVYSGPEYAGMKVDGSKIILSFKHVGNGLVAKGGPLLGFTIAGQDRHFVKAEAEIQEDKVVVWSPKVELPVAVRFGWADYPVVNFWNKDGLPATPFRTDDFPMMTNPQKRTTTTSARSR